MEIKKINGDRLLETDSNFAVPEFSKDPIPMKVEKGRLYKDVEKALKKRKDKKIQVSIEGLHQVYSSAVIMEDKEEMKLKDADYMFKDMMS